MARILELLIYLIMFKISICNSFQLSKEFVEKNEIFALKFYKNLVNISEHKNKSIVISPFSIQTAGSLLYAGANGITADEMFKGFQLFTRNSTILGNTFETILLQIANSPFMKMFNKIYIMDNTKINPNFMKIANKNYKSEVENIDFRKKFEAATKMNKWIQNNTEDMITDFIEPYSISDTMKMFLINAIHFKGLWEKKFKPEYTSKGDFWISKNKSIKVDMMFKIGNYKFGNIPQFSAMCVEIPFKEKHSLFIVLPRHNDLETIEKNIYKINLYKIFNEVRAIKMALRLPKFLIQTSVNMENIFKFMGMGYMFSSDADFSKLLLSNEQLEVSQATHKAVIKIDENGAEASAISGFGISFKSGPFNMNINQPFLYFIKGEKGEIYFMGRYLGD